jgi:catechol 2,3-dioxygenase-like lactoylglutathione lyase family enzyme
LTVTDLETAGAFFRDALGFTLTSSTRQSGEAVERMTGVPGAEIDIVFAHRPDCTIELMRYVKPEGLRNFGLRPCDTGFAHVAFEAADLDEVATIMREAGYAPVSDPQVVPAGPRKGGRNLYVRGPDDIVIEFQTAPPGFTDLNRL